MVSINRFLLRRIKELKPQGRDLLNSNDYPEPGKNNFPHNSGSFTAKWIEFAVRTTIFSMILFILCVLVWSEIYNSTTKTPTALIMLAENPKSYSLHLNYIQNLILTNRLDLAGRELSALSFADRIMVKTQDEATRFKRLHESYLEKKNLYAATIRAKYYWSSFMASHPEYRDGYYLAAQYSYSLFDEEFTIYYLTEAIALDPQFSVGKIVKAKLVTSN